MNRLKLSIFTASALLALSTMVSAAMDVQTVQTQWAKIKYATPEYQREDAFEKLVEAIESEAPQHRKDAEFLAWQGIVLSTYAGEKGGLGALGVVKKARKALEASLEVDPTALNGSAYTSLGALYYQVPGWPVGFGDDDKAKEYLEKGLSLNPNGIDSNYFYADYLFEQKEYRQAKETLSRALRAPPRPNRESADNGRRLEISDLLAKVEKKLRD